MITTLAHRKLSLCALAPLLGLLLAFMTGCAALQPMPQPDAAPAATWVRFQEAQQSSASMPNAFSLSASLYYSAAGRTNRTILDIWGDRTYPLRLDVRAGIGAALAHMREDEEGLTVFYPSELKAFQQPNSRAALPALGLDLPFNLLDLTMLLLGQANRLVPAVYVSARLDGREYVYALPSDSAIAEVRLLPDGSLSGLTGRGERPWTIEIAGYRRHPEAGNIPERLSMSVPQRQEASVRLRNLSFREEPWEATALELKLPPQVQAAVIR